MRRFISFARGWRDSHRGTRELAKFSSWKTPKALEFFNGELYWDGRDSLASITCTQITG